MESKILPEGRVYTIEWYDRGFSSYPEKDEGVWAEWLETYDEASMFFAHKEHARDWAQNIADEEKIKTRVVSWKIERDDDFCIEYDREPEEEEDDEV